MTMKSRNNTPLVEIDLYSDQDRAQFNALSDGISNLTPLISSQFRPLESDDSRQFSYSHSDQEAFNKLLHSNEGKNSLGTTTVQRFPKVGTGDRYTNRDTANFETLMKFDGSSSFGSGPDQSNTTQSERQTGNFTYTETDLLAFENLKSTGSMDDSDNNAKQPELAGISNQLLVSKNSTDRDVGPIKIIEYNKQGSAPATARDRANENIKIRFYD